MRRMRFAWCLPRVVLYRAADPCRFRVVRNSLNGIVIGVAFQIGRVVLSVVWGTTRLSPRTPPLAGTDER